MRDSNRGLDSRNSIRVTKEALYSILTLYKHYSEQEILDYDKESLNISIQDFRNILTSFGVPQIYIENLFFDDNSPHSPFVFRCDDRENYENLFEILNNIKSRAELFCYNSRTIRLSDETVKKLVFAYEKEANNRFLDNLEMIDVEELDLYYLKSLFKFYNVQESDLDKLVKEPNASGEFSFAFHLDSLAQKDLLLRELLVYKERSEEFYLQVGSKLSQDLLEKTANMDEDFADKRMQNFLSSIGNNERESLSKDIGPSIILRESTIIDLISLYQFETGRSSFDSGDIDIKDYDISYLKSMFKYFEIKDKFIDCLTEINEEKVTVSKISNYSFNLKSVEDKRELHSDLSEIIKKSKEKVEIIDLDKIIKPIPDNSPELKPSENNKSLKSESLSSKKESFSLHV